MNLKRYVTTILCGVCLSYGGAVWAQATVFTWSGRVTDNNTGQPVANVALAATGNLTGTRVVVTDANGNYTLNLAGNTELSLRPYRTNYALSPLTVNRTSPIIIQGTATQDFTATALPFPILIFALPPVLLTEDGTLQALTLNAQTRTRDPLAANTALNFNADKRTRLALFLVDLDLYNNETLANTITVVAEDTQARLYNLLPEDLRKVPGVAWLSQLTVRVPPEIANAGTLRVRVSARGQASNAASVRFNE